MRILAVADVVEPVLQEGFDAASWRQAGIDLLVSCGDLPRDYLSDLTTRFQRPLLYVLGNHDGAYVHTPPVGCISIDGRAGRWQGLRVLGLGGAPPHNGGSELRSEERVAWHLRLLQFQVWRLGGLDLVVTHAPPTYPWPRADPGAQAAGAGRGPDFGHRGYRAFADLIRRYPPRALLHGHTHLGYGANRRTHVVEGVRIIDVYGHAVVDL